MTPWFYIFIFSGLGMIAVLSFRMYEDSRGAVRVLDPIREPIDRLLVSIFSTVHKMIQTGGVKALHAGKRAWYNRTTRQMIKRILLLIARFLHDILVLFLRMLGKIRKGILSFYEKHKD